MEATDEESAEGPMDESSAPPTRESFLPSWVLQMRAKIEASRVAHSDATSRLTNLNKEVSILSGRINEMLPVKPKLEPLPLESTSLKLPKPKNDLSPTLLSPRSLKISFSQAHAPLKVTPKFPLANLPGDVFVLIFEHLSFNEIFRVRLCNRALRLQVDESYFWIYWGKHRLPFLFTSSHFLPSRVFIQQVVCDETLPATPTNGILSRIMEYRQQIESYLRRKNQALRFLAMMKEQRSIPKFKQVDPRRYGRNDRQITHPLPLFETSDLSSAVAINSNLLMSHAETLNSDFRTFAHHALDAMVLLSAQLYTSVARSLIDAGVVTVMVSLLANEEATLQNYSCTVLANLLCWDACSRRDSSGFMHSTYEDLANGSIPVLSSLNSTYSSLLTDQLSACNGKRQLPTLLTSPSASVNLVMRSHHLQHAQQYSGPSSASSSESTLPSLKPIAGGTMSVRGTSRIQGVCNKSASRALINMFYPDFPMHTDRSLAESYRRNKEMATASDATASSSQSNSLPPIGKLNSAESNGDAQQAATSSGHPSPASTYVLFHPLHRHFAQETFARSWQFTYFYKSGAFKDQFVTHLRFLPSGTIIGSGHDNIGAFIVTGEVQRDILDQTLFIQKTYLSSGGSSATPFLGLVDNALSPLELRSEAFFDLLLGKLEAIPSSGSGDKGGNFGSTPLASAHVVHVAYWSDGIPSHLYRSVGCQQLNTQGSAPPPHVPLTPNFTSAEEPNELW